MSDLASRTSIGGRAPDETPATAAVRVGRVPLVGRTKELERLRVEIVDAFAGAPRAVFLAGEAGIGKSRLLRAAIASARRTDRETAVLFGRCVDERGMPPYLPWLDAWATFPAGGNDGPGSQALRGFLAGEAPPEAVEAASLSSEQRKLRLFDAATASVAGLASTRPVVLAFDDLHWSDAASNELLRYLLTHAPPVPLLVVGAYRSEEAPANAELTRTLTELDRRRLLTTVQVGPLDLADTERLVAGLLREHRPDPALVATIHEHCEGNPFFVEEVVRALAEERGLAIDGERQANGADAPPVPPPLPPGVAAVVERRLDRVSESCRSVLEVAALVGQQIPGDLVAEVAGIGTEAAAGALEEAAGAALVRPLAADEALADGSGLGYPPDFAFLHDRVRETVAARINPVRRRTLHGRIAAALEAAPGPTSELAWLAAITHHHRLGRDPAAAAAFAARLGDAAMRAHAHAEAVRAYRTAVDLAPAIATPADLPEPGELLLRLGDAALAAGDPDAVTAFVEAERRFAAAGDRRGVARARRRLGTAHARREEFDLAVAYLEGALAILTERGDEERAAIEAEMAEVLVELGSINGLSLGRYAEAVTAGRQALALATRRTDEAPTLEARARLALANTLMRAGRLTEGQALLPVALTRALGAGDPNLAAEVAGALANYHYWVGDLDASERAALRRRELATQGGDPYALRHAVPWLAFLAAARGDWQRAERLLAEAEGHVARVDSPEPRAFLRQIGGFALLVRGRYPEAIAALEEAIAGFRGSGAGTLVWYLGCLATAYLAAGDDAAGARVEAEVVELIEAMPAEALPRAPALAELGTIAALRQDREAADRWYRELQAFSGQLHWVLVDRVLGMLAALRGDLTAADRHFVAATEQARRGAIRPELALSLVERGMALRRSPDASARAIAEPLLRDALALLRSLDMAGDVARIAGLIDGDTPSPGRAAELPAGLSEREVEVLALVAQGLTNREIGARLGISEKTVTNHLTHIFTKANLDNRAAAVAFALRHGLA